MVHTDCSQFIYKLLNRTSKYVGGRQEVCGCCCCWYCWCNFLTHQLNVLQLICFLLRVRPSPNPAPPGPWKPAFALNARHTPFWGAKWRAQLGGCSGGLLVVADSIRQRWSRDVVSTRTCPCRALFEAKQHVHVYYAVNVVNKSKTERQRL